MTTEEPRVDVAASTEDLERQDRRQDIGMKRVYGYVLLTAMLLQVFVADAVFVKYAATGADWELSPTVVNVWLVAALAEVVAIVAVVTRSLFPQR